VNLRTLLERDEGRVRHAYQDHMGYWTLGVGRLIDSRKGGGLSDEEIDFLLDNDIKAKTAEVRKALSWFDRLDEVRQAVLVSMAFQMGTAGLLKFKNTLALIERGDYPAAARGMLESLWAKQTPLRAARLADMMEEGAWV
jgi:lysozyme